MANTGPLKITQNRANGVQKQLSKKENISDKISWRNIELVLQYTCSLSEQVRNESENCLHPPVTLCVLYVN